MLESWCLILNLVWMHLLVFMLFLLLQFYQTSGYFFVCFQYTDLLLLYVYINIYIRIYHHYYTRGVAYKKGFYTGSREIRLGQRRYLTQYITLRPPSGTPRQLSIRLLTTPLPLNSTSLGEDAHPTTTQRSATVSYFSQQQAAT